MKPPMIAECVHVTFPLSAKQGGVGVQRGWGWGAPRLAEDPQETWLEGVGRITWAFCRIPDLRDCRLAGLQAGMAYALMFLVGVSDWQAKCAAVPSTASSQSWFFLFESRAETWLSWTSMIMLVCCPASARKQLGSVAVPAHTGAGHVHVGACSAACWPDLRRHQHVWV